MSTPFLVAYADRIGERLRSTNQASESASDGSKLLPVLSARSRVVEGAALTDPSGLGSHRVVLLRRP